MNQKIGQRFNELEIQHQQIIATKKISQGAYGSSEVIDSELFTGWKVKVRNLLSIACGADSQHFQALASGEKHHTMESSYSVLKRLGAIFSASKEDFEGGYLTSIRKIVQAEVFDSELEQALELLNNGYKLASAVIAGVVLETTLRDLCDHHSIAHGSLNAMNVELAKLGAYSKLQQKRITALADIRNSAAHGKPSDFTDEDVKSMIRDIESFLLVCLA